MTRLAFIFVTLIFYCSCHKPSTYSILPIPISLTEPAETPNLYLSPQGNLYLSWIQHRPDSSTSLFYSRLDQEIWSKPIEAASGKDWFVNWADFPSVTTYPSSELSVLAQYLSKRDTLSDYNYDIRLALSRDGGVHFRTIDSLHDSVPAEHGFVSLIPYSFDKIIAIWLDGGALSGAMDATDHHKHSIAEGAMQLHSALVDFDGKISNRLIVDDFVCDCCQTDACMTPRGPILVYRNRTTSNEGEEEIRDIYYTRYVEGHWALPKPVHNDHWKINGCPVNGPAISSLDNKVAIVWYTEAEGHPEIQLAYSKDGGDSFSEPIKIKTEHALGRVDVSWINPDRIAVSFLDQLTTKNNVAVLKLYSYSIQNASFQSTDIEKVSSIRKTGFPVMEKWNNSIYFAYTMLSKENEPTIKTVKWFSNR